MAKSKNSIKRRKKLNTRINRSKKPRYEISQECKDLLDIVNGTVITETLAPSEAKDILFENGKIKKQYIIKK